MPKDNENMPLLDIGPTAPAESRGFPPDQMVPCENCLRANAPTRISCLYCGAPLPFNEQAASLQKPSLRPLEKWEQAYNNIFLPHSFKGISPTQTAELAGFLKLSQEQLNRILSGRTTLPLAQAAAHEEAQLVESRLRDFGIDCLIVSDADLDLEHPPMRIRSADFNEEGLMAHQSGGSESVHVLWDTLTVLVQGRLFVKNLETREQGAKRNERQIVEASETYSDEAVVDLYSSDFQRGLRITANSFDFSCLGKRKGLLANENFKYLLQTITQRAPAAVNDASFALVRRSLEAVWPSQKQTASRGMRRERPGRITFEAVTESSNENQFTRYSRLRNYLHTHPELYGS